METKTGSLGETIGSDQSDASVSRKVIEAVADAKGVDPLDLPPLYDSIDPDALDRLFDGAKSVASGAGLRFEFAGCEVRVRGTGEVLVVRTDADSDPFEGESQSDQDASWGAVEDRCGIGFGDGGRSDAHYN